MVRRLFNFSLQFCLILFFSACGSNNNSNLNDIYHLDKKFWNANDYKNAVERIKYSTNKQEKKPCYSIPEKAPIIRKLIDKGNIAVTIEDNALGLKHRSDFASEIFNHYRNLSEVYQELDREDKFVYPVELADILNFGLYLQLNYFDLGNKEILQNSDNPDDPYVKSILSSNIQTLIGNYCNYLGFINQEKAFSDEALNVYIKGIEDYFTQLIEKFPNANFHVMNQKAQDMLKKSNSEKTKTALNNLISKIEAKKI